MEIESTGSKIRSFRDIRVLKDFRNILTSLKKRFNFRQILFFLVLDFKKCIIKILIISETRCINAFHIFVIFPKINMNYSKKYDSWRKNYLNLKIRIEKRNIGDSTQNVHYYFHIIMLLCSHMGLWFEVAVIELKMYWFLRKE